MFVILIFSWTPFVAGGIVYTFVLLTVSRAPLYVEIYLVYVYYDAPFKKACLLRLRSSAGFYPYIFYIAIVFQKQAAQMRGFTTHTPL